MAHGLKLSHGDGTPLEDASSYRRLVGRLLNLTATRPDLTFAIQQLSQFIDAPADKHLSATQRAACSETRKSITEYCIFLGLALISWRAKKQVTVSRSSSEAEYRALAATVELSKPATIFCDNKSAIVIAENHVFHERTKHICR
ncbi:PREDICTED: uncharacterized protein LOC109187038 [Ipomoea nil]|uniref:uncharacterized protein LOC109187038 n=1 Tax=Ipomoea nil TaxID=35883 RepID=UPI000900FDE8|nr:PREDICTED: uncharacterized protein LOC109187038 [Ipomoea nil]